METNKFDELVAEIVQGVITQLPYEVKGSKEIESVGRLSDDAIEILSERRKLVRNSKFRLKDGVKVSVIINPKTQHIEKEATIKLDSVIGGKSTNEKSEILSQFGVDAIKVVEVPCFEVSACFEEKEANFYWHEFQILIRNGSKYHLLKSVEKDEGNHSKGIWNIFIQSFDLYNYLTENALCEIY